MNASSKSPTNSTNRPDTLGRMLSSRTTAALGVLLPQPIPEVMENPYYAQFIVGIGQVCDRDGMTLLLVPPLRNSMLKAIPYAAVDGFIVCGLETDRGEVAELRRRGIPFVLADSERLEDAPSFEVSDREGAEAMMRHLLDLGHRRITILAFEAGPDRPQRGYRGPLGRRLDGITAALADRDLTIDGTDIDIVEIPANRAAGFRASGEILTRVQPPPRSSRCPTSSPPAPSTPPTTSASTSQASYPSPDTTISPKPPGCGPGSRPCSGPSSQRGASPPTSSPPSSAARPATPIRYSRPPSSSASPQDPLRPASKARDRRRARAVASQFPACPGCGGRRVGPAARRAASWSAHRASPIRRDWLRLPSRSSVSSHPTWLRAGACRARLDSGGPSGPGPQGPLPMDCLLTCVH